MTLGTPDNITVADTMNHRATGLHVWNYCPHHRWIGEMEQRTMVIKWPKSKQRWRLQMTDNITLSLSKTNHLDLEARFWILCFFPWEIASTWVPSAQGDVSFVQLNFQDYRVGHFFDLFFCELSIAAAFWGFDVVPLHLRHARICSFPFFSPWRRSSCHSERDPPVRRLEVDKHCQLSDTTRTTRSANGPTCSGSGRMRRQRNWRSLLGTW